METVGNQLATQPALSVERDMEEEVALLMMSGISVQQQKAAEWELYKENVRPLKRGRNVTLLVDALNGQQDPSKRLNLLAQRRRMIEMIDEYQGDDPLSPWIQCIKWIQESFPSGGESAGLVVIYEHCVRTFWHDDHYKDDLRYLKVWLEYAAHCSDAEVIFCFLEANEIGKKHAIFYSSYAKHLKSKRKLKKAFEIFNLGIARKAQPLEKLQTTYQSFLTEMTNKSQHCEEDSTGMSARSFGTILNRTDTTLQNSENALPLKPRQKLQKIDNNRPLSIYRDENTIANASKMHENAKGQEISWHCLGTQSERNKENNTIPSKWTSYKVPNKLPRSRPTQKDCIEVYVDEDCAGSHPNGNSENAKQSTLKLRITASQKLKKETELLKENPLRYFPPKDLR